MLPEDEETPAPLLIDTDPPVEVPCDVDPAVMTTLPPTPELVAPTERVKDPA